MQFDSVVCICRWTDIPAGRNSDLCLRFVEFVRFSSWSMKGFLSQKLISNSNTIRSKLLIIFFKITKNHSKISYLFLHNLSSQREYYALLIMGGVSEFLLLIHKTFHRILCCTKKNWKKSMMSLFIDRVLCTKCIISHFYLKKDCLGICQLKTRCHWLLIFLHDKIFVIDIIYKNLIDSLFFDDESE